MERSRFASDYRLDTMCSNCSKTLAEHMGFHCKQGPKHFEYPADTDYDGELISVERVYKYEWQRAIAEGRA